MPAEITPDRLRDMIVTALVRRHGSTAQRWRVAVGPIKVHDRRSYPHCNWSVDPAGTIPQNAAIETLLDRIRLEHPIVSGG